jgi:hypothetical protein
MLGMRAVVVSGENWLEMRGMRAVMVGGVYMAGAAVAAEWRYVHRRSLAFF